jgi:hypothetical protein
MKSFFVALLFAFAIVHVNGQDKIKTFDWWAGTTVDPNAAKQAQFDAVVALGDYVISPIPTGTGNGGAYKETTLTTRASINGDVVLGLKAFGNNPYSITNLPFTGTILNKSAYTVWNNNRNTSTFLAPYFVDRGGFDEWLQFHNSVIGSANFETNAGSLSPALSRPLDVVWAVRFIPKTSFEGAGFFKDQGGIIRFNATTGALDGSVGFNNYQDQVIRLYIDAAGAWQMWKNNVSIGSGTGANVTDNEILIGTVSHVMEHHMRLLMIKKSQFTAGELTTIYTNLQAIWPWAKPTYPLIDNLHQGGFGILSGNQYIPGNGRATTFTGGNGTFGSEEVQCFYVDTNDVTLFPGGDVPFACNRQVPATLNISTMGAGNTVNQITMDGVNLLSSAVSFNTNTATTAANIVTAINSGPQSANFFGYVKNNVVQVHIKNNNYRPDVLAASVTGFTPTIVQTVRTRGGLNKTIHNAAGQIFDGYAFDGTIRVFWAITPIDSGGNRGETILTDATSVNF